MSSGRWANLPISEQELQHLASTTTTTMRSSAVTADSLSELRRRTGGLIREEVAEGDRTICYYRNLDQEQPLPFLCELGCCRRGCCAVGERATESTTYKWALVLLAVVILTILASLAALLAVYYINKRKTAALRRRLASSSQATESSNVSQISVPASASYYYPGGYYPYMSKESQQF